MSDPIFTLTTTNPFGLSDVGSDASPTFVDIDGDGDVDGFVGNSAGNTLFYRNTGTTNSPVFVAPLTNHFGISDVGSDASPSFVDIDRDGDSDAFVGNSAGDILFFKNTGTTNNPVFAAASTNPFGLSNVGSYVKPAFVDIDGDGDLDVFVCTYYQEMQFFRNTGTASNPVFAAPSTNTFGLFNNYYSDPTFVDIEGDGDLDAFLGFDGHFSIDTAFFRNTGTVNNPEFSDPQSTPFGLSKVSRASPTFIDIDSDGDLDAFMGDSSGNTVFFVNDGLLLVSKTGNDSLTGTPSPNDTATYASAPAAVTVSLLINTSQNTIGAGQDTLSNIENLIGSGFGDNLTGDAKHNVLTGGAGNDTLRGWSGADSLIGGTGNDSYFVENSGDVVTEKFSQGTDNVSSTVAYTLLTNVENLTLTGASAINGTGNGQANVLIGNAAGNQLNGKAGNDVLDGKAGNNVLTGGTGNDIFRFATKGHLDKITDYNVSNDTIQLENAAFTALTATGTLAAGQFRIGTQAMDANDFIVYSSVTGKLFYDADGNGAAAAVQIATIGSGLAMTNADIVVI